MKLLLFLALLQTATSGAGPGPGSILSDEELRGLDPLGSCAGRGGPIDMDRVMFLENRSIVVDGPNGPLRVSVEGEDLFVKEVGKDSRHREYFNNIGYQVDDKDDLDVELKLAYVVGKLAVYWKETYQHRIYRHGFFALDEKEFFQAADRGVTPLCAGHGGSHSER